MEFKNYNNMSDEELTAILIKFKLAAQGLMDRITELKATKSGSARRDARDVTVAEYAKLKNQLKKYITLRS